VYLLSFPTCYSSMPSYRSLLSPSQACSSLKRSRSAISDRAAAHSERSKRLFNAEARLVMPWPMPAALLNSPGIFLIPIQRISPWTCSCYVTKQRHASDNMGICESPWDRLGKPSLGDQTAHGRGGGTARISAACTGQQNETPQQMW
jgi:hypothetical protein